MDSNNTLLEDMAHSGQRSPYALLENRAFFIFIFMAKKKEENNMPLEAYELKIDGSLVFRSAETLTLEDKGKSFICIDCRAKLGTRNIDSNRTKCFCGHHTHPCRYASNGKRIEHDHTYVFKPEDVINYCDVLKSEKPSIKAKPIKESEDEFLLPELEDDIAIDYKPQVINNAKKFYAAARQNPYGLEEIGIDLSKCFLNPETSSYFHNNGLSGMMMLELKTINIKRFDPPLPTIPGAAVLMETGVTDPKKAFYFIIRMHNKALNEEKMWNKLKTLKSGDYVVVWTNKLEKIENDYYSVYSALDLNSREFTIVHR